jgi:hypothetical protein
MEKKSVITVLFIYLLSIQSFGQTELIKCRCQDSMMQMMKQLDLKQWEGKSVGSFLKEAAFQHYYSVFPIEGSTGKASFFVFTYAYSLIDVRLFLDKVQMHQLLTQFSGMDGLKQLPIQKIEIKYGDRGCKEILKKE